MTAVASHGEVPPMTLFEMTTWTVLALLVGALAWYDTRAPGSYLTEGSAISRLGHLALMAWLLLPVAIFVTIVLSVPYMIIT